MVLAYHIVFGAYGFWLPNDPRGSWSEYVGSRALRFFGPATKTVQRQSVARHSHDRVRRLLAKQSLKQAPIEFTGLQALEVARGFAGAVKSANYHTLACAIMPNHVHLVIGRHDRHVKRIAGQFKSFATRHLHRAGWFGDSAVWAEGSWAVFLDSTSDVERAIRYVVNKPVKDGFKAQSWSFVQPLPNPI